MVGYWSQNIAIKIIEKLLNNKIKIVTYHLCLFYLQSIWIHLLMELEQKCGKL